jgi:peptidoglycan/xylan/chitin deacetylase (PgdA/CDA1 family)
MKSTVVFSVDDGYRSVYTNIYPLMKKYGITITLGLVCNYLCYSKRSDNKSRTYLNVSEVQEMIKSCGIEVASHSLSHPFLTKITSNQVWNEITRSKSLLELLFSCEVVSFIYPYGDMNQSIRNIVKQAGYKLARTCLSGNPDFKKDPYRLPSFEIRMATKLQNIQDWILKHEVTILLLHQIVKTPKFYTQWSLSAFTELLNWINNLNVRVLTLKSLYAENNMTSSV